MTAPDPEHLAAMVRQGFPPVVYAPMTQDGDGLTRLEMLQLVDGRTALFVYSAIDRLHAWWRQGSPWVLLSVEHLQRAHEQSPFDLLLLDRRPSMTTAAAAGSADG